MTTITDVTEQLMAEFDDQFALPVIVEVVRGCQDDLQGAPAGAVPELLERLARQRLRDLMPRMR